MARTDAVWGIDIGNCSLKALRCRQGDEPDRLVADAFDFIEYPKILTQPDASPAELVQDALQQFLSRNQVRGSRVAISVSGQAGLARFIKLPPVETKKIAAIVQYEARQQIPFDLDDVIWDYQRMGGGMEEEGFALETEIGLFAMKRDQVLRALEPFDQAGIEVDIVQLTPLTLFNFAVFDQLRDLPPVEEYDPDSPPPSTVILSMGTDSSDLVVTNGFRVWQRSIPLGGNHFTKALTKELKLTFAKAEHLKRNAGTAQDPKAVFQAMRPVFNDLLTEIQRSIGYFSSIDRAAKIEKMLALGNTVKLPGLRRYLSQSLGFEVDRLESFAGLTGSEVTGAPAFQENLASFGVCYGLCVQGLKQASLRTNLLPKEIVKDRVIKAKKPWAVAAAAVLLIGCTISLASHASALRTVDKNLFGRAESQADSVKSEADNFKSEADKAKEQFEGTKKIGVNVVDSVQGRVRWLRLLKTVGDCLPSDGKQSPENIEERNELHIRSLDCQQIDAEKAKLWLQTMVDLGWWEGPPEELAAAGITVTDPNAAGGAASTAPGGDTSVPATATPSATTAAATDSSATPGTPTEGGTAEESPGGIWLVQLTGYHYHNGARERQNFGAEYVRNTLIRNLREGQIFIPEDDFQKPEMVAIKDLAIRYPVLVNPGTIQREYMYPDSEIEFSGTPGEGGMMSSPAMRPTSGPGPGPMPTMRPPAGMGSMMPGSSPTGMGSMMPGSSPTGMGMGPGMGVSQDGTPPGAIELRRFDFTLQFIWEPLPPGHRKKAMEQAQNQANAEQGAAPGEPVAPATNAPGSTVPDPNAPGAVPPGANVPAPAVPGANVPAPAAPGANVPGPAVPGANASVPAGPGANVPGVPGQNVPGAADPGAAGPVAPAPAAPQNPTQP